MPPNPRNPWFVGNLCVCVEEEGGAAAGGAEGRRWTDLFDTILDILPAECCTGAAPQLQLRMAGAPGNESACTTSSNASGVCGCGGDWPASARGSICYVSRKG